MAPTVNPSLSRGLADRILAEYADILPRFSDGIRKIGWKRLMKRSDVRRKYHDLVALTERLSLSAVAANHPRWRWATVFPLVPERREIEGRPHNRSLIFRLFPLQMHVGMGCCVPEDHREILEVSEHAFERLFLRLNSVDLEAIKDEIHEALCLSAHLRAAADSLQLKQIVLPTKSGAFLGDLPANTRAIRANTWIAYADANAKYEKVARGIASEFAVMGGGRLLGEAIGSLAYGATLADVEVCDALVSELARHPWLKNQYEPGTDVHGLIWAEAQRQAELQAGVRHPQ
jgi:hypothetical protein